MKEKSETIQLICRALFHAALQSDAIIAGGDVFVLRYPSYWNMLGRPCSKLCLDIPQFIEPETILLMLLRNIHLAQSVSGAELVLHV